MSEELMIRLDTRLARSQTSAYLSRLRASDGWRFDCPFCGKDKAAINYEIGWFECYHKSCRKRVSTRDNTMVHRFQAQIRQAVRSILYSYRGWHFEWIDAYQHAAARVTAYAGKPSEHDADAGKLWDWELSVNGEPEQLERYLLHALNCDMKDWARKQSRRKRREAEEISLNDESNEDALVTPDIADADEGNLSEYPALAIKWSVRGKRGVPDKEIAEDLGVSVKEVKAILADELTRYKKANGITALSAPILSVTQITKKGAHFRMPFGEVSL